MAARAVPFAVTEQAIEKDGELLNAEALTSPREIGAMQTRYRTAYSQQKLNEIHRHLWCAGSRDNYSPLHHQKVLLRDIVLSERPDLHLVWHGRIIYVQPLPSSLLNHDFFQLVVCPDPMLYCSVLGFLYSYVQLMPYPSDLALAHDLGLVSRSVTWDAWTRFRAAFIASISPGGIPRSFMNQRYEYGELRLRRLDYIFRCSGRGVSYFTTHREYSTYFREYISAGITLFAFVTVALTAMQVLVGTEGGSQALRTTSYWFSVAILLVIATFGVVISMLFTIMFTINAVIAVKHGFE
ncbi:hypothetical protein PVAG01_11129 [Phlyctema vagabunda]|uniref:Uncharacterized protein n=1 Tax=Phlyctema vagabunda TaxID=108571 RepID=A0ABR4P1E2_9HELO